MRRLVRDIRAIEEAMGNGVKRMADGERPQRDKLAKSVVAAQAIPAGTRIERNMLTAKGPGSGIPANKLESLVGRIAQVAVEEDTRLPNEALDWPSGVSVGSPR
jgi:sialic acid synthase SpsE